MNLLINDRVLTRPEVAGEELAYPPPQANGSDTLIREVELAIPTPADTAQQFELTGYIPQNSG